MDGHLGQWLQDRRRLEADLLDVRIVLAKLAGNITDSDRAICGVTLDRANLITDIASLEAHQHLARIARDADHA